MFSVNGWVKFHRKIEEWEWYTDVNTFKLFFHLILKANHKDKTWKGVEIKRGQLLTGRKQLAKETGLSEQNIKTSIKHLKMTNEVTSKVTNKYSIITITNYDSYQDEKDEASQQTDPQLTSNQPATNQQLTTTKNVKKVKNEKKLKHYVSLWNEKANEFGLSKIISLSDKRKKKFSIRNSESNFDLVKIIEKIQKNTPHLIGQNDRGWKVSIDWILENNNNYIKILENKYLKFEVNKPTAINEVKDCYLDDEDWEEPF